MLLLSVTRKLSSKLAFNRIFAKFSTLDAYGSFRNHERQAKPEIETQSTELAYQMSKFRNVDHLWTDLKDGQVSLAIDSLKQFCMQARLAKMDEALRQRSGRVRMIFEDPSNTNNMWAALRTFDSFGIQFIDVIVNESRTISAFRKRTMAQAMGAQKWLTLTQQSSTVDYIKHLKLEGYRIIATDLHERSKCLQDINWSPEPQSVTEINNKVAIVMGNENVGISQEMRELADELFYIPMKGFAESFNVNAASAIVCAHLDMKGVLSTPLPAASQQRLLLTWLCRTVNCSIAVLQQAGIPVDEDYLKYEKICGTSSRP